MTTDTPLKQYQEHAAHLKQMHSKRDSLFEQMEDYYWMNWQEERTVINQMKNVKVTRSPRARNAIMGAMRLLIASDPQISVPHDTNNAQAVASSSNIEKFCKAMWFASGRVTGDPIHYDAVRSALLYSEVQIAINSTADMLKLAGDGSPALVKRLEEINKRTPYLFEVLNPKMGYPEYDNWGLTAYYREVESTVGHVQDMFGEEGERALKSSETKKEISRFDKVVIGDFYDLRDRVVWLKGYNQPVLQEAHELPFIPIVAQIVEGSNLFEKAEDKREPFLYTLYKSGLLDRENLILTVLYTMLFAIGANPMFVDYIRDPDNPPEVDFSQPGGTVHYQIGERREAMLKQVIDPSLLQGWEIATDLEMQSTIYRQTLGEPLGANAPYSMVALLSQAGRLPLTVTQRKASWAIGEAMEIACKWIKSGKKKATARYQELRGELSPEDIPDDLDIKVKLEIELPQDQLQAANTANMLAQGERPLVSQAWVLENILGVGQPGDMKREIWDELASDEQFKQYIFEKMATTNALRQGAIAPGAGSGIAGTPPISSVGGPPIAGTPPQPQQAYPNFPPGAAPQEPFPPYPPLNGRHRPIPPQR